MAFHYHPQSRGALEAIKVPGSLSVWKDDMEGEKKRRNLISILSLLREQGQADTAPNQYSGCDSEEPSTVRCKPTEAGFLMVWQGGRLPVSGGQKAAALVGGGAGLGLHYSRP